MEPQNVHGVRSGRLARFVTRFSPFVLLSVPILVSELVELGAMLLGQVVIGDYLLQLQDFTVYIPPLFVIPVELLNLLALVLFLLPVFRANPLKRRGVRIEPALLRTARRRVQRFPTFLVVCTYLSWMATTGIFIRELPPEYPAPAFFAVGTLALLTNALVAFYLSDFLNRIYLIPYWFPDGQIQREKLFNPPMLLRFMDFFLFLGILPVLSLIGCITLVYLYGAHDAGELLRLIVASSAIGLVFWFFGFLLTLLHAGSLILPLRAMEKAARDLMEERFDTRVVVQADDPIGRLSAAFNLVSAELEEKQKIKTLFGHYVSPAIRDLILQNRVNTRGDLIEAVILFSDIRSFTRLTEKTPPETVVDILNIHFSSIVDIVTGNNGFVDKFIGDAVMAVFDAEFCDNRHRFHALNTACSILRGMEETNRKITELGVGEIKIGVGMACGRVIRGNIGSHSRRELTVIGDTVNVASRLESATRKAGYQLIFTEDSYDPVLDLATDLQIDRTLSLFIRGKRQPVRAMGVRLVEAESTLA